jgi:NAD(P)-dependent dehydrogenase (short-subunit alcohol dehydrogenase family)
VGMLDGKVAIITGGASGIGAASVRLFAEEGCRVLVADIQDEKGRRLAEEISGDVTYLHTDVSREGDVRAAVHGSSSWTQPFSSPPPPSLPSWS